MKKVIVAGLILSLLFGLGGCTTKPLSAKQSQKNFVTYQNTLKTIAEGYGYKLLDEVLTFEGLTKQLK